MSIGEGVSASLHHELFLSYGAAGYHYAPVGASYYGPAYSCESSATMLYVGTIFAYGGVRSLLSLVNMPMCPYSHRHTTFTVFLYCIICTLAGH